MSNSLPMLRISLCFVALMFVSSLSAQLEGGIKIGVNTYEVEYEGISIFDAGNKKYSLSIDNTELGFQGGLYTRLKIWKLFLQLETFINSNKVSYRLNDITKIDAETIYKEQYTNLTIPLVLGIKFGWFNLQGGITGHYTIANHSQLTDLVDFAKGSNKFTYGYLAGLGFDISRVRIDLRYELNTTYFGDHIVYKGNTYKFDDRDNRFILNLGIKI